MKPTIILISLGLLVAGGCAPSMAQTFLPGLDELIGRGELKVGMFTYDSPPMVMTDKNGETTGYDVKIATTIAKALGVKLTIVRTENTAQGVIDQVARGDVDIGVSYLTRTLDRAREVLFTRPYITQDLTLLVNRVHAAQHRGECPTIDAFVAELPDVPIGVENGSAYANDLDAINPNADLMRFDSLSAMMDALRVGTIAISFQGDLVARHYLANNPSMRVFAMLCDLPDWKENIAIAVNGKEQALVPFLDVLLDQIHITTEGDTVSLTTDPWAY
jgi:polar amino acid transport system substrate-binding protein